MISARRAYEIRCDRARDVVEWRADGQVIARQARAGAPFGVGLFTLLDPLCDDRERVDDHARIPGFIHHHFQALFGQGGRVPIRNLEIEL